MQRNRTVKLLYYALQGLDVFTSLGEGGLEGRITDPLAISQSNMKAEFLLPL